jgi:glycosyltransferase involved in cell wall biosynthesis
MSMPVVAAAAKLTKSPCLWHAREIMARRFPAGALAGVCSRIVVPSERMARILETRIAPADRGKIVVIPSPIDPEAYSPPPSIHSPDRLRSELGLPASGRLLLMVGQHVPWKGHLELIRALPLIREQIPDVRLILVGGPWTKADRSYSRRLEDAARDLAARGLVFFRPPSAEVQRYYWAADLLVLPSRAEPFGRVALEALAARLPVVVSEDAGIAPAVAKLSPDLLAKPGDPRALADTVVAALGAEPDARREWLERGRALVRRSFSAETVVPAIERVYLDAID